MLVLSDHDRSRQPGWPPATRWTPRCVRELEPPWQAAWAALSGEAQVWTAEVPDAADQAVDGLVAIRRAPRSQFAVWQEGDGGAVAPGRGILSIADSGSGFRGQRDRAWIAADGNLHLCACFRPPPEAVEAGVGWTLLPAVAALEAIREVCGDRLHPAVKWVNDIWVDGRKVAGVLAAARLRSGVVERAVIGIGLNVRHAPAPTEAMAVPAGCLCDAAKLPALHPGHVLFPLMRAIARTYRVLTEAGPDPLLDAYRRDSLVIGRRVQIRRDDDDPAAGLLAEGVVCSVEADLSLRLHGVPEPVRMGRLTFADPPAPPDGL